MKIQCPLQSEEFHIHIFCFFEKCLHNSSVGLATRVASCHSLGHSECILFQCFLPRDKLLGFLLKSRLPNASPPLKPQFKRQSPVFLQSQPLLALTYAAFHNPLLLPQQYFCRLCSPTSLLRHLPSETSFLLCLPL